MLFQGNEIIANNFPIRLGIGKGIVPLKKGFASHKNLQE
jgi:hypothetical protein